MSSRDAVSPEVVEATKSIRAKLSIDESNIVEEARVQPDLYLEASDLYVMVKGAASAAKRALKFVEGQKLLDIVHNSKKYGLVKSTQDVVQACLQSDGKYQEALRDYNIAECDLASVTGLLEAFSQRRSSIKGLIELYIGQAYGSNGTTGSIAASERIEQQITDMRAEKAARDDSTQ